MRAASCAAALFIGACAALAQNPAEGGPAAVELAKAAVVLKGDDALVRKAAMVLIEEANARANVGLRPSNKAEEKTIIVGLEADVAGDPAVKAVLDKLPATGKDGYKLAVMPDGTTVVVAGNDPRAVLYGVGKLLFSSELRPGSMRLAADTAVSTTPKYPIRGHEMSRSPRAKSPQEGWVLDNFEKYVRELALFGMSAIELSRHTPEDYVRIAKSYGMDIWIVSMYNGRNFDPKGDPRVLWERELKTREEIYKRMPAIDHILVKSGDPGNLSIADVFAFAEKEGKVLKKCHPNAKIWIAPQHFVRAPQSYFDTFIELANAAQWLDGAGFGPWCRMPFKTMREKLRADLPIRNFPDITHIYSSQYPAYALDLPMAMTLGRICINPSPVAQKHIHNLYADLGVGSLTYSEGTNDDLNKFFWIAQDWNPEAPAEEGVRDYARFFIGPDLAEDYTKGTFMLEQNLVGPLAENAGIMQTLELWRSLERRAGAKNMENVRFLMPLLRAYYDAYMYQRWVYEMDLEKRAYDALREAPQTGVSRAIAKARAILGEAQRKPVALDLKKRINELYKAVYDDPGRWTMEYQHCPLMDQIDVSLNDNEWILSQLAQIEGMSATQDRAGKIMALVNRTDPGQGGFYYNLGDFSSEKVTGIDAAWKWDPSYIESPHRGYGVQMKKGFVITHNGVSGEPVPRQWLTQAGIYWDQPMELTFEGFDPAAAYTIRIAYVGEASRYKSHVRLDADGVPVHEMFRLEGDVVREFDLPPEATSDGKVTLRWQSAEGERGVHVGEIFFIRKDAQK